MALSLKGRALHFVFKVPNRTKTVKFYREILGMQVLRHEEFSQGCEAACNGPYAGRWSKTMMGYGPEDCHFVIELTYNYEVKSYELGNDFLGLTIKSSEIIQRAKQHDWSVEELHGKFTIIEPGGYKFNIINEPQPKNADPIQKVTLACSNLQKTIDYWNGILGLAIMAQSAQSVSLAFEKNQCVLEFQCIGRPVNHAQAYGRIAFAVPKISLPLIEDKIKSKGHTVLTPLISLDTPGKASVTVVILADPDGHEICFVDEEGFSELSKVDATANKELDKNIAHDKTEA